MFSPFEKGKIFGLNFISLECQFEIIDHVSYNLIRTQNNLNKWVLIVWACFYLTQNSFFLHIRGYLLSINTLNVKIKHIKMQLLNALGRTLGCCETVIYQKGVEYLYARVRCYIPPTPTMLQTKIFQKGNKEPISLMFLIWTDTDVPR